MNSTLNKRAGINDRIKVAISSEEIQALLNKAKGFKKIHPATLRKLHRSAELRVAYLQTIDGIINPTKK